MPLYREWSSDPYSLAAIWEIKEPESFFMEKTGITSDIRNEKKRLEHLAGRFLLKHLEKDFPLLHIKSDEHDKPRVAHNQFYFSISHSFPYVAAVISPQVECGIDIQVWHPHIERLQHKFLSKREQLFFHNEPELITAAWCAKEAVYKWQGRRGIEFIEHLPIEDVKKISRELNIIFNLKLTLSKTKIIAKSFTEKDFACSVIIHDDIFHPYS